MFEKIQNFWTEIGSQKKSCVVLRKCYCGLKKKLSVTTVQSVNEWVEVLHYFIGAAW